MTEQHTDQPALRRALAAAALVVAVLALVAVVATVLSLRPRFDRAEAEQQDRAAAVRAAEQFAARMNTYDAGSLQGYRASVTRLLSPKFKTDYAKAMDQVLTAVQQAKVTSKGDVLASGVASLDQDSADVLVVADAAVSSEASGRLARHFRWDVSLVKIDGRWLVDNFTPVA